jgi:hypothetical protein
VTSTAHLTLAVSREPKRIPTTAEARAEGLCQRCGQVRPTARTCGMQNPSTGHMCVFYLCGPCIEDGRAEGYVIVA